MEHEYLTPIGQVAVFYLPKAKLDWDEYAKNGKTPRNQIHKFCMDNHGAYTMEESAIVGYWQSRRTDLPIREDNVRYEVSFADGEGKVNKFVEFLSDLCCLMQEEAIYLTMGYKSYLVLPRT